MDITFISSFSTAIITAIVSVYLFRLWYKQSSRMYTDLPLMFSLSFLATAVNMFLNAAPVLLQIEYTYSLFQIRAFFICLSVIPMLGMVLHIWLARFAKWHIRIMVLIVAYWLAVTLLAPDESTLMALAIPVMLVFTLSLIATFVVTWYTGRLKEVRSDLLVFGLALAFVSQALRVTLLNAGLGVVGDILNLFGLVAVSLALVNPWYNPESMPREIPVEQHESAIY
jgi:hypothetical protein